ncbi:type IX secretion system membrane protein PorP/SprF [Cytophagaceae bacterium ABcell3]|nr:type IX secretion system membrane protein PorP/SprF [Cytophagaceae bacterium ABcell3]
MKLRATFLSILTILLAGVVFESRGQDVQFSQFYNVPMHLNPAFAGSAHQTRGTLHNRLQWPSLDATYTTSLISADTYFPEYKSGVGVMVVQDIMGGADFMSTDVVLQYAYEVHINENITFRPGLQLGYVSRTVDYSGLIFPQQVDDQGQHDFGNPYGLGNRIHYVDIGSGGILYSKDFWVGASAHHMNRPNQSFTGDVARQAIKYSFVGGYKIRLKSKQKYLAYLQSEPERAIVPTVHYKMQGPSDQLDVGVYAMYDMVMAGVWYRGIPIKKYDSFLRNHESVVLLGGVKFGNFSFSYSYDIVVSRLSTVNTFGAHEFNLTYVHNRQPKKRKKMKRLPCPSF